VHLHPIRVVTDELLHDPLERGTRIDGEIDGERDLIDARARVHVEDDRAVAVVLLEGTPQRPQQRDLRSADVDMDGAVAPPRGEARIVVGEHNLREDLRRLNDSASDEPVITREATLASATPVALDENGTVRDARGFASRTKTLPSPTSPV